MDNNEKISKICRLILQNEKKMTKELDIINLCTNSEELEELLPEIVARFEQIGFNLVRSKYRNEKYYVLTGIGKDDQISPKMYGALGLIIAYFNELGEEQPVTELKVIFAEIWDEITQLINLNYLQIFPGMKGEMLVITPLAKACFRSVLKELDFKKYLQFGE
jgi:hypothetical protein